MKNSYCTDESLYTFLTRVVFPNPPMPTTDITSSSSVAALSHPTTFSASLSKPTTFSSSTDGGHLKCRV
ncbi:hypothetical protein Hanom_Chr08g00705851 [Helianthus anomalus]